MLASWIEILPLFIVRWLALRYCERLPMYREGHQRLVAVARSDTYFRVPNKP